jgi:hypothetical protein
VGGVLPEDFPGEFAGVAAGVDRLSALGWKGEAVEDLREAGERDQPRTEPAPPAVGTALQREIPAYRGRRTIASITSTPIGTGATVPMSATETVSECVDRPLARPHRLAASTQGRADWNGYARTPGYARSGDLEHQLLAHNVVRISPERQAERAT